jgi:mannose-6-phosphate isomerase-like protein (cupin superfamily)
MMQEEQMAMTQQIISGYVMQPDQGQVIEELRVRLMATGALTGGAMSALECVNPGPGGPPLHIHHAHDEWYFVLQGRYRFRTGEVERDGGPGSFAYIPRGIIHSFASVGPEEGRVLVVDLPGGLEHFLEDLADLQARGAGEEEIIAIHEKYQSEICGPPLV